MIAYIKSQLDQPLDHDHQYKRVLLQLYKKFKNRPVFMSVHVNRLLLSERVLLLQGPMGGFLTVFLLG